MSILMTNVLRWLETNDHSYLQSRDEFMYFVFVVYYQWLVMDSIRSVVHE